MRDGQRDAGPTVKSTLERWVKSFVFSIVCFSIWGSLTVLRARALTHAFDWMELVWLVYNATVAALFLIRRRPSIVSLEPEHWLVALLTSFSGLFFEKSSAGLPGTEPVADGLIFVGLAGAASTALALGRNYDFLPALRGVTTSWLYGVVRHPMYVFSILIRLGYVAKHASVFNVGMFGVMVWLYGCRALFEERILSQDQTYNQYVGRVRYRFLPGLY